MKVSSLGSREAGCSRQEARVVILAVAVAWLMAAPASAQVLGPMVEAFWAAESGDEIDEAGRSTRTSGPGRPTIQTRCKGASS